MPSGLEQYAISKYAEAFEVVPRTLAENSGLDASAAVSGLYAAHASGQTNAGEATGVSKYVCLQSRWGDEYSGVWANLLITVFHRG
jgi:T-complex protein 1 subunit theta